MWDWEVIGAIAGVAGAVAAFLALIPVLGLLRSRRRKRREHTATSTATAPSSNAAEGMPGAGAVGSVEAPLGRLPVSVRGRDDLLGQLRHLAQASSVEQVQVVAGLGGSGKTTVALALARELRRSRRAVWWVEATSRSQIEALLLQAAHDDLGVAAGVIQEARAGRRDAADVFWKAIHRTGQPGAFALILDNADDPQPVLAGSAAAVADGNGWIRASTTCLTVVTSRDRDPATWGPLCQIHTVAPLEAQAAAQILHDLAPQVSDRHNAVALAQRLQCLPLALHLAGTYLAWPHAEHHSFADYQQALQRDLISVLDRRPPLSPVAQPSLDRQVIARTWQLSLNTLSRQKVPAAAQLAVVLAQLADAQMIPRLMLRPARLATLTKVTSHQVSSALDALVRVGIADEVNEGDITGLRLHPLVAETLRATPPATRRIRQPFSRSPAPAWDIAVQALHATTNALDHYQPGHWPVGSLLEEHLRALIDRRPHRPHRDRLRDLAASSITIAAVLQRRGSYPSAQQLLHTAVSTTAALPEHDLTLLRLRRVLGVVLHFSGRYEEAQTIFREVLANQERVLGADHPETLRIRHNIAGLLGDLGRYEEAQTIYGPLLVAFERVLGADHSDTLRTRHNFAFLLHAMKRYEEAQAVCSLLLAAQERVLGTDHPNTLLTRSLLANVLHAIGQHQEAQTILQNVLAAQERVLGTDHPNTLLTRSLLANVLHAIGQHQEAQTILQNVLAAQERVLGTDHPTTLGTRHNLASWRRQAGLA